MDRTLKILCYAALAAVFALGAALLFIKEMDIESSFMIRWKETAQTGEDAIFVFSVYDHEKKAASRIESVEIEDQRGVKIPLNIHESGTIKAALFPSGRLARGVNILKIIISADGVGRDIAIPVEMGDAAKESPCHDPECLRAAAPDKPHIFPVNGKTVLGMEQAFVIFSGQKEMKGAPCVAAIEASYCAPSGISAEMNSEGAGFFRCKPEAQGILFRVVSDGCDPAFQFTEEITAEPLKAVFNKFGESGGGFSAELKSIYDSGELFCAVFKGDRFKTLRFVQLRSHAGRLDFQPDGAGLFHIACSFSAAVDPRLSVRAAFAKDSYGTLHTPATLPVLAALKAPPGSGLVSLNTYQDDLNRVDMQKKRIKTFSVAGIIVITTAVFAAVLVWIRRSARKVQEDFSRVSEGDESIAAPHSFLFILLLAGFMALDVALLIYLLLM